MDDFHQYFSDSHIFPYQYFFQETKYGYLPAYPVATGVLLSPFYMVPVYSYNNLNRSVADWFEFAKIAQKISASIITALSVSLFYLLSLQLNAKRGLALLLSLAYGFATQAWSISSQALWQHGPGILFMFLAALLAIYQLKKPSIPKGILFGLACGLAVSTRPTNLLFVLPLYIWMVAKQPRFTFSYTWPLGLIGLGLAGYNYIALGNVRGADLYLLPLSGSFWKDFVGLLWSPGRGLFIYFPLAIFGILGFYHVFRVKHFYLSFFSVLFLFILLQIALVSKWTIWWGGDCFGPRMLSEIEPMLLLLSIPLLSKYSYKSFIWTGFYVLLIWSFFIQIVGILVDKETLNWNQFPYFIETSQNRLWNWKNNPISWEFRREIGRAGENNFGLLKFITKNAQAGDMESQALLGKIYLMGAEVPKNDAEAMKWFQKAAEQGDPIGQFNLGLMYHDGITVAKDQAEAVNWFRKAAEQGDPFGQYNLGIMYHNGFGLDKDESEAVRWFRKAAEQGFSNGQVSLGIMYRDGLGVAKDETEAIRWFRKAAEQFSSNGEVNLGVMYHLGLGVDKDETEALKWFHRAAEQGNSKGYVILAEMYHHGLGVVKNDMEAIKWYRKAADLGDSRGQYFLGLMYANGIGVDKDYVEALKWFRKSADQGFAEGQVMLGLFFENGYGVPKNVAEALKWYRMAAEQGSILGQNNLRRASH